MNLFQSNVEIHSIIDTHGKLTYYNDHRTSRCILKCQLVYKEYCIYLIKYQLNLELPLQTVGHSVREEAVAAAME